MTKQQSGLSLVELMVAMVVSLILIAGVIQIFVANKQSFRLAEASSRVQDNARFAMDLLSRDIRMAGYRGCAGSAATLVNTLNNTTGYPYSFDESIGGFEATSSSAWSPTMDSSVSSPLGGRDVLAIRGTFDNGVAITGQPSNSGDCSSSASFTADMKVSDASLFSDGDIVMAGNCSNVCIFQITNVNSGENIVHNTGGSVSPGNATKNCGACFAGNGDMFKLSTRTYFIRNNDAGEPSLYRQDGTGAAEEMVDGVEDMQVLYGVDTDNDRLANSYVRANDVTSWPQVVSVRVSLLLRSPEDNVTTAPQAYTYNGSTVTPTDRRLRRVYTTTIGVRNNLP